MPDDLMGYLGLNTRDFESGIKRAERATGALAKAGIIATGAFAAVAVAINSFRNLGKEIDETRAKLVRGTQEAREFDEAVGEGGGTAMEKTGRKLDTFLMRLKKGGAIAAEVAGALIADVISAATGGKKDDIQSADAAERSANESADALKDKILKQEDAIAAKRGRGIVTLRDQEKLLLMQLDLERDRLELANMEGISDAEKANAAKANIGAIETEIELQKIAVTNESIRGFAKAQAMKAEMSGQRELAKLYETIADYDERILKAKREGNGFLEMELRLQKQLALQAGGVSEHNMTPKERREQRAAARRAQREVRELKGSAIKTVGRGLRIGKVGGLGSGAMAGAEADLAARLARAEKEGHALTPGSELDRFRIRRDAIAGGRAPVPGGAASISSPSMEKILTSIDTKMDNAFKQK